MSNKTTAPVDLETIEEMIPGVLANPMEEGDALAAMIPELIAEARRLRKSLHEAHVMIGRREDQARSLLCREYTEDDLHRLVEWLIIDGADACDRFGPCPVCISRKQ